jgi:hypothetical protein
MIARKLKILICLLNQLPKISMINNNNNNKPELIRQNIKKKMDLMIRLKQIEAKNKHK